MAEELAGVIEELRAETDLREQILASMREGVILAGSSSELVYANQAASQMFGNERMAMVPPQLDRLGEQEFTVHHPRRRDLRSTSVRLSDGRTLSVIQDQTERKRVESIRRDFVANASHELKTPVAGILVTAETVEQAIDENIEFAKKFAANLVREARRLSALVQDLLDLARLEDDKAEISPVRLTQVVLEEVAAVRDRVASKGLTLHVDLPDEVEVLGGREDLAVMVRNLLENAVGYTASGSITVTLRDTGEEFELAVADTGVGIPTSDLERIFERFYRVDRARSRDTGGTGLGLSIVRHVVERSGGTVKAISELGHGSTFVVRLPHPPPPTQV
jgi:signal transduction histidine kinase